jgi:hypothetical protein
MAINKNFVVKNGLEVSTNLIIADSDTRRVGIATSQPGYLLDVAGGIGATDVYVRNNLYAVGVGTFATKLSVGTNGTTLTGVGGSVGLGTALPAYVLDVRSPVSTGQTALYVKGDVRVTGDLFIEDDLSVDEITARQGTITNLNSIGITTVGFITATNAYVGVATVGFLTATNLTSQQLNVSGISTLGVTSTTNLTSQQLNVSGISTLGVTSATNLTSQQLNVSGITTVGFITANSFIVSGISTLGVTSATNLTSQQLNVSGISTLGVTSATNLISQQLNVSGISTLGITSATNLTSQQLNVSGISTLGVTSVTNLTSQQLNVSGISTLGITSATNLTSRQLNVSGITTLGVTTTTNLTSQQLTVSGISTFTSGPVLIGRTTSTGTASQTLQVENGAYFGDKVGIGTTRPNEKLHIVGDVQIDGVVTGTFSPTLVGNITSALFATNAGTSTSVIGGIASVTQLNVSGISTFDNNIHIPSSSVGIGTTNPTAKLHVVSSSNPNVETLINSGIQIKSKSTSYTSGLNYNIKQSVNFSTIEFGNEFGGLTCSDQNDSRKASISFFKDTGFLSAGIWLSPSGYGDFDSAGSNGLIIRNSGNIGIGTINPTTRISIAGTTGISFADSNIRIGDVSTGSSITTGFSNFFGGNNAGQFTTTGSYNNFLGLWAGRYNSTGSYNNMLGYLAGGAGDNNNFLGQSAGSANLTGNNNNFLGKSAGFNNNSGSNNIFLGQEAGFTNQTGSQNIVIGYNQDTPILNGSNQLVIGAGNTAWITGNSSYNVGIGTTNPTSRLHLVGDASSGPTLQFENKDKELDSGDVLGAIDFISNDDSGGSNGSRVRILSDVTDNLGTGRLQIQVKYSSSTVFSTPLTITPTQVSIPTTSSFFAPTINRTKILSGDVSIGGANPQQTSDVDISLMAIVSTQSVSMIECSVVGIYYTTGIGTAYMHKKWTQNVYYDGTKYVIVGAGIATAYNSDATNFVAGAINTGVATSFASGNDLYLRFKGRTNQSAPAYTGFSYNVTSITNGS